MADFSVPYYETGAGFIANIPRELSKWSALLRPYRQNSWISIVMAVLGSGPFLWFFATWYHQPISIPGSYQISCKIILYQGNINSYITSEICNSFLKFNLKNSCQGCWASGRSAGIFSLNLFFAPCVKVQ